MARPPIRGLVVCVDYVDLLEVVLPRALAHLAEVLVITSPVDTATQTFCKRFQNVRTHVTGAFYHHGAVFNKGAAVEEGFDVLGREGWILVFDADIVMPRMLPIPPDIEPGKLYSCHRRILNDPAHWDENLIWKELPRRVESEFAGYFQLFHAADPVLVTRPWYATDWIHAGGCDSVFQRLWHESDKVRIPFDVLHLGPVDQNWFGRASAYRHGGLPTNAEKNAEQMSAMFAARSRGGWRGNWSYYRERLAPRDATPPSAGRSEPAEPASPPPPC